MTIDEKLSRLEEILKGTGGALVAFSGGVDSTFLAKVARDVLGDGAAAVTVRSQIHAKFEFEEAKEIAKAIGIRHIVVTVDALAVPGLASNPPGRCYICKHQILGTLIEIAKSERLPVVVEGTHAGDADDFRPGMRAVRELGVRSPLAEAGLTKPEIRELSCRMGLPTWSKPSYACLASRIPYGQEISIDKLQQVEQGEDYLRSKGYKVFRVRHHGEIARLELAPDEMKRFAAAENFHEVSRYFKTLGFSYVALDLEGYRTGSLNEVLPRK
jgi:pyridinium-3,5-biscarboxylic acid mononucleotide sulfurtransferase